MASDFLSQEEIDALLAGNGSQASDAVTPEPSDEDLLSLFDRDALGEIGNISFGTAATALSTLLRQKVNITTPQVRLLKPNQLNQDFPVPHVAARVEYTEGLSGSNILMILVDDAKIIADLMLGGDGTAPSEELNELHISAVAEAMNQMMGSASTSMSTMFHRTVNISPPVVEVVDLKQETDHLFTGFAEELLVEVSFHLQVGNLIDSNIMQMLPLSFAKLLVQMLMGTTEQAAQAPTSAPVATAAAEVATAAATQAYAGSGQATSQQLRGGTKSSSAAVDPEPKITSQREQPVVERAVFSAFDEAPATHAGRNLDLLLDIPLGLTVELGRTKKLIRDILDLAPGSIIELEALAGEPVDILVNNKLIARGEVVVIDEKFGVRVTDILSPAERIKRLQ
ncbi:flagellar motor switch phosphatase FliY [Sulfoacidibacillus thermotolerans]|uniref:Flagellar motor switch phosphatase FliY n=1 Tax=Sulfoacidibacillus thermotolerans TaxID=1765684 RepID=A0A2U3DA88_SULT2|nr:flagellar motor switch phosphatase FliY [Sulfoacidibacillus thermotolerans]PWI58196.1 hypothetical protein BM613_04490 [Sulfoacidibacillus thermotolerans]